VVDALSRIFHRRGDRRHVQGLMGHRAVFQVDQAEFPDHELQATVIILAAKQSAQW